MIQNTDLSDEESRWNALVQRDRSAGGVFYYAVKTTGVFCRPGCSSRLPKRENVEFFDNTEEAELAGYRACKRCKPDATSPRERLVGVIIQACRCIEKSETCPTLEQLASKAGLSSWHFHRKFKEIVGVTPKQYATTQQARRFRDSLKTERTITSAIYEAGFSSSSRAYETARDRLAMTPSRYRQEALGLTIRYGITSCFLGWIIVAVTNRGTCAVEVGETPEILPAQVQKCFPKAFLEEGGPELIDLIKTVISFIEVPASGIELPMDIQGAAFQERVWNALCLDPRSRVTIGVPTYIFDPLQ